MRCPDAESIAQLASASEEERGTIADHAAACESCRAVLAVLLLSATPGTDVTEPDYGSAERSPTMVDRYRIVRRLGSGGMGVVYAARDPELDRDLAIKMLHRDAPAARLRREAQALARLSHPNVVAVHDVGEHGGQVFVAMALVDGVNLRQWLAEKHPTSEVLRALCAAARGIVAAHAAGLIHRDLKPDNIFVASTNEVLVGDFGLACDIDDEPSVSRLAAIGSNELTLTGTVLGTPAYMAPEQASGAATERSDQFSFCVTAYEALFGTRPFPGNRFEDLQASIAAGTITSPPRRHDVSARVERALRRGLRADPAERFPSMVALLAEIEPRPRRWPYIALGAGAVGAAISTTLLLTRGAASPGVDVEAACAPTTKLIETVWGAPQRQSLATALAAQGHMPDTLIELQRRLDGYAADWTRERRAACVSGITERDTPVQIAGRVACLEARKSNLEATIASMTAGTSGDVFGTWKRVISLPPAASCSGDDAIRMSSGGPAHQALMRDLAHAMSIDDAPYAALARSAEEAKDLPAVLEIELALATDALDRSRVVDADAALERARPLSESLGVPSARVRALALSARSLCIQGRAAEADQFLAMAVAGEKRLRAAENEAELDEVFTARAECMYRRGEERALVPLLLERIAEVQRRYGREGLEEAQLRHRLGQAYIDLQRPEDAARESRLAHGIEMRFVADDKAAVATEDGLALEAMQNNDLEGAIRHQRRTVEMLEAMHAPELAASTAELAELYDISVKNAASISLYTRAIELVPLAATGEDAVARAESFDNRGWVYLRVGDVAHAVQDFQAAIEAGTKIKRTDRVVSAQIGLGCAWVASGEFDRALRLLRPALAIYGKKSDRPAGRLGFAQFALAQALWETGDRAAAVALARDAEAWTAAWLAKIKAIPLAQKVVPIFETLLTNIERWRDAHR